MKVLNCMRLFNRFCQSVEMWDIRVMLDHDFPQFRKAAGGRSYYKIQSLTDVLEIQVIGSRYTWHKLHATIYPEKVFIGDLIDCTNNSFVRIMEEEFSEFVSHCENNLEVWAQ